MCKIYTTLRTAALSQVVAIILLILISTVMASILYVFITQHLSAQSTAIEHEATNVKLKIDGVRKAYEDTNWISYEIWMTNPGEVTIHLDYVYLIDPSSDTIVHRYYAGEWSIAPGDTQYLWLAIPKNKVKDGHTYVVKVTVKEGNEVYYRFTIYFDK